MDEFSKLNCSRLPTNTKRLRNYAHSMDHTYTPIQQKLPFLHHIQHKQQHSELDTLCTSSNRNNGHRTHSKRWQRGKCHRQHINHQPNEHSSHHDADTTTSTIPMNFSKKFSFTQHNNHLSRFYMIFIIFIIYLLDKINCDQGECMFYFTISEKNTFFEEKMFIFDVFSSCFSLKM